jgi:hypothetical protein
MEAPTGVYNHLFKTKHHCDVCKNKNFVITLKKATKLHYFKLELLSINIVVKQRQCYTSVCFCPSRKISDRLLEQSINIKFCAKLGKSTSETLQMLTEDYGADTMKKSSVFEWHKRFKESWENMKDDKRTGHKKTHRRDENVEKVWKLVCSDRRLSV